MIARLLAMIGLPSWFAWAALGLVLLVGGLAGTTLLARDRARQAEAHAATLTGDLRANEAALGELRQLHQLSIEALERQAAAAVQLAARTAETRRAIANAPNTTACAASPAMRAALAGLRQPVAAAPGGRAVQPAAIPAQLPAAAAGAR